MKKYKKKKKIKKILFTMFLRIHHMDIDIVFIFNFPPTKHWKKNQSDRRQIILS